VGNGRKIPHPADTTIREGIENGWMNWREGMPRFTTRKSLQSFTDCATRLRSWKKHYGVGLWCRLAGVKAVIVRRATGFEEWP